MAQEFVMGVVVSTLFQEFLDIIKTCTYNQVCHAFSDVEKKLETLEISYVKAQTLLDNVDGWDLVTSKPIRNWVGDAIRACYEMEDLIVNVKLELKKTKNNTLSYLRNRAFSRDIDELQSKLDVLAQASDFIAPENKPTGTSSSSIIAKEPVIVPAQYESFCRKRDKDEIIEKLIFSERSSRSVIISLEGMFGIGKSMLAQVVRNDAKIQRYFEHRIWVSVSGDFTLDKVLSSVFQQEQIDQQQHLATFQSYCVGKKILIVLDDLCNFARTQDWEEFHSLLLGPTSIFGLLITTRNPKVTRIVSALSTIYVVPHYLRLLSDADCQSLILSRAGSASGNPPKRKRSTFEYKALKIAKEFCTGLPLAADIIGLDIYSKPEQGWNNMLSRKLWDMPEFREQIFPVFSPIYSDSPKYLKDCFRYFSLFPSGFNFQKEDLVSLWMAEGFVRHSVSSEPNYSSLDETGNDYFDELLSRSVLQVFGSSIQEPKVYRVHDFVHQYAQYVSSNIYLQIDNDFIDAHTFSDGGQLQLTEAATAIWFRRARHFSLLCHRIPPSLLKGLETCKAMRTLICLHEGAHVGPLSYKLFLTLQSLRVLILRATDIVKLPESLGRLIHLELLDLSGTYIQDLPASTSHLHELRVLNLEDCGELLRLPRHIKRLSNLRRLQVNGTGLSGMPPKIGKLRNLHTLPLFITGEEDGYLITELRYLRNLRGSICLKNLENVMSYAEALEANLKNKPLLRKLELEWNSRSMDPSIAKEVLQGLEPHENMEQLRISGYNGAEFPLWMSSHECGLISIHFQGCHKCSILPSLGQLQQLDDLHIQGMQSVRYLDHMFSSGGDVACFPSLVNLKIEEMESLERWEGLQANQMPRLRDLEISSCPKFTALPTLRSLTSLKVLKVYACPLLQSLPQEGLPSSLESLLIEDCDLLKQRCQPGEGADWQTIKSVPQVFIDFVEIKTLSGI